MGHRSRYLVNEEPIPLYPSLAVALGGADRALVLQQLNYWLVRSKHIHAGRYWVYNTVEAWQVQFPWLSQSTVRRILAYLEQEGLILTGNYNRVATDRTKWYTIDDAAVGALLAASPLVKPPDPSAHSEQMQDAKSSSWSAQNERTQPLDLDNSNQRDRSEISAETTQRVPTERSKATPAEIDATAEHSSVIRRYLTDYSAEFGDVEHVVANCTCALNLWRRSGKSRYDFLTDLAYARGATRQYQGKQPPGVRIERKMAYFFAVLENRLRGEPSALPGAADAGRGAAPSLEAGSEGIHHRSRPPRRTARPRDPVHPAGCRPNALPEGGTGTSPATCAPTAGSRARPRVKAQAEARDNAE